ncbi:expressed unknown protein [Seminavis robusta]|uniref:Uncharacterized protein n=1 Tax=Seminavis robusta TaxID=568900 RepID=A0A9N8ES47_9STRA|nr:expressed unknown protein [Seminavis robusta]|eukprot:Sro1530_g280060.1 n/a (210) ;mRNA; f:4742-5371
MMRFWLLLLAAMMATATAQSQEELFLEQQQQQCPVTVGNTDELCASLLHRVPLGTPEDCDCYTFCNDELIQCGAFGEHRPFQCVGRIVAGCRQAQANFNTQELPTAQDTVVEKKKECAVTVNADNAVCGSFLDKTQDTTCDCYNYCNGKLIGCLNFGERNTFSCSGETVAGCLDSQRQFGALASGGVTTTRQLSGMIVALIMGTAVLAL